MTNFTVCTFFGRKMSASLSLWGAFLMMGFLNNVIPFSLIVWGVLLGLLVMSTSIAYIIYFRVLATAGVTNILLVTFLVPISASFLGVMILGEDLRWNVLVGMSLIFLGFIAIDGRLLKRFKA